MKLSELRRIIREIIEEQATPAGSTLVPWTGPGPQLGVGGTSPGINQPPTIDPNNPLQVSPIMPYITPGGQNTGAGKFDREYCNNALKNLSKTRDRKSSDEFRKYMELCVNTHAVGRPLQKPPAKTKFDTGIEHDCPSCPEQE